MTAPGSRGPTGHTLKIKCPTWEHVESFYAQKIKDGNLLSARVPFSPRKDEVVILALELPDELVIAIEARVDDVVPAPDGRKSAVRLDVFGLTEAVRARLLGLVRDGRRGKAIATPRPGPVSRPPISTEPALPVPLPPDAPIDEIIEPLVVPTLDKIPGAHRAPAQQLVATLERLKAAAAHDVLGVRWGASVEEIRKGYFELVLHFHPDRFARHGSAAVSLIAQEVFIHINKAYDRMREAAVAAGEAIAAGPALLPHRGWLAGFEDIGAIPSRRAGGQDVAVATPREAAPTTARAAAPASGSAPDAQLRQPSTAGRGSTPGGLGSGGPGSGAAPSAVRRAATDQPAATVSAAAAPVRRAGSEPAASAAAAPVRRAGSEPAASAAAAPVRRAGSEPAASAAAAPVRRAGSEPAASAAAAPVRRAGSEQPAAVVQRRAASEPLVAVPLNEASLFDGLDDEPSAAVPLANPGAPAAPAAGVGGGAERAIEEARAELEAGNFQSARDRLVQVLQHSPRDRAARSLYHVAQASLLASEGKMVDAISQLEAALAHDPTSVEARRKLDGLKEQTRKAGKGGLFGRLFNK